MKNGQPVPATNLYQLKQNIMAIKAAADESITTITTIFHSYKNGWFYSLRICELKCRMCFTKNLLRKTLTIHESFKSLRCLIY